jgi:penicillin-binding protein 2
VGDVPLESTELAHFNATNENWDRIALAMESVVHSPRGTAKIIAPNAPIRIAGKTGTAQVISIAQEAKYDRNKIHERNRDHALFISYAPADNPRVAVAVMVENGEHGSSGAAPIARKLYDAWFDIEKSKMGNQSIDHLLMEDLDGP